jgi:glucose/arabinose dehydrogenase
MLRFDRFSFACGLVCVACAVEAQLSFTTLATGLARPLAIVPSPVDSRLFIVEQRTGTTGRIRVYKNGGLLATPYLTISPVSTGSEQGLLGMAFDPDFANNRRFYVNYTNASGHTVVARYTAPSTSSDVADASSADIIFTVNQPYENHNGGTLQFGPDGMLYISLGDGGSQNDPGNRAQNRDNLLGKILRIDVTGDDFPLDPDKDYRIPSDNPFASSAGADEVWSWGWRNPWKFAFDPRRLGGYGGMTVADVGQDNWEEIDHEPEATGGRNYGWRAMEGFVSTGLTGGVPPYTDPIYAYSHSMGCSITGGVLYRGSRLGPSFFGRYFFTDYCNPRLYSVRVTIDPLTGEATADDFVDHISLGSVNPTSLHADQNGELYYTTVGGSFRRINQATAFYAIEGQFIWNGLDPSAIPPRFATVEYRSQSTGALLLSLEVGLAANGRFRLPAPTGAIRVSVKKTHWLRRTVNANTSSADATGLVFDMINGDADGDNEITIGDYALISSAFGSVPGNPNWNADADLNEDGEVSIGDFAIVSANFGLEGDT